MEAISELITIKQASEWATSYLKKNVTPSNISYLIQYGRIKRVNSNGNTFIDKKELIRYYNSFIGKREIEWKSQLGGDLNWALSFDHLKEADTTKHVHRLHPYKGKFIPQLVEYFLDGHKDNFKKETYFKKGDIVLDPFCGSGTLLVQANELGMYAVGIDISAFNSLISNVKISSYNFADLDYQIQNVTKNLKQFIENSKITQFDNKLTYELINFNNSYFPVPNYKYKLNRGEINEETYGEEKEGEFLKTYKRLCAKYSIELKQEKSYNFLDRWYLKNIRNEMDFVFNLIDQIENADAKKILSIILSRTIRSCRATTHADLTTLKEPIIEPYYCSKHGKICKPLFSILSWWERYSKDTLIRLMQFDKLRTDTYQICLTGDSRAINIFEELEKANPAFYRLVKHNRIKGIFSSPPYVGLIDYHEQHAYAYDLFGFERKDKLEIGPLFKGTGREAKEDYTKGISDVLNNCKKYLSEDYDIFLVANDKYNIYSKIAENAEMQIINHYKRPVLNRTEKDKGAYSETIFHLKTE